MDHGRYDYSPIIDREPLRLPDGSRVAVWVVPNIEHFHFDRPGTAIAPVTANLSPDVLNYGWRDFGVRVGVWRLLDVLVRHSIPATVALNSDVCQHYPRIVEATRALGWEHMGHGRTNSEWLNGLPQEQERKLINQVIDTIAKATGSRPRGWLSPSLTESPHTPDLLAEAGISYVADWANDEQPYPMTVRQGSLLSMPYSIEINDMAVFLGGNGSGEEFTQRIVDQFDALYEDGQTSGRIMAIGLHPFLIGHGFRIRYLDKALAHIRSRHDVWLASGGEIADWYRSR
ncbi:MAG: polysaccharide deacetylase family protein [Gammaproteobacteria bacterium]|nr:polysaccharide deacetylase family protein [Gammaproteobacteria bacterium]